MPQFMRVRGNGCQLYFPETFRDGRYRGREGYVVDLDAPCEREWCRDQMHKLEPAPDAKAADEIKHPVALKRIREERKRLEDEGPVQSDPAAPAAPSATPIGTPSVPASAPAASPAPSSDPLEVKRTQGGKKAS